MTLAITTLSCKGNQEDAVIEYGVTSGILKESVESTQKLINRITEYVLALKSNNNMAVNTDELKQLLATSNSNLKSSISNLEVVQDSDNDIQYRSKTLAYLKLFHSFTENEIPEFIRLLETDTNNKYEKGSKIISTKLTEIKAAEIEMEKAKNDLLEKYNITIEY